MISFFASVSLAGSRQEFGSKVHDRSDAVSESTMRLRGRLSWKHWSFHILGFLRFQQCSTSGSRGDYVVMQLMNRLIMCLSGFDGFPELVVFPFCVTLMRHCFASQLSKFL